MRIPVAVGPRYVGVELYELRHVCGSCAVNILDLPAEAVAQHLGYSDCGALAMKLYGHADECLRRSRMAAAVAGRDAANVPSLRQQCRSMGTNQVPEAVDLALARDAASLSTYPAHFAPPSGVLGRPLGSRPERATRSAATRSPGC